MKNLVTDILLLACFILLPSCIGGNNGNTTTGHTKEGENKQSDKASVAYDIESLMNAFWNETSYLRIDSMRLKVMSEMQAFGDLCSNTEFAAYNENISSEECAQMEKGSILLYYRKALEHVLEGIKEQQVEEGSIVMWQLYNMGYIVKTPTHCFGIDIFHKHATELVPYLDFLLITHEHSDHYTSALVSAMTKAGKAVYSNFVENEFKVTGTQKMKIVDDIEIETNIVDHNAKLRNFVVSYQINCGKASGNCVILHIGDCFNADQLKPTENIDIFIPHLAVGLDMPKAVERVKPEIVLMSHIMELGHPVNKWRWSYEYGVARCKELTHKKVYLPVWGEKITYKKP